MKEKNMSLAGIISLLMFTAPAQAELNNIQTSGVIQTEISSISSDSNGDSSDIVVPTVEFGIEASLSDQVDAAITLLAEDIGTDEQTALEVDEAIINLAVGSGTLTIGQTTVPFGVYETGVLSDPTTLLLGETAETIVMYSIKNDTGLSFSGYIFNGDVDDGDNEINDLGLSISMAKENWSFGADVISNLGDSDTLGSLASAAINDDIAGLAVYGSFTAGNFTFMAEHVRAMDTFNVGDAAGLEPSATHVDINFTFSDDQQIAISLSSSNDATGLVDYESQTAIAYSTTLMQKVGFTVEILNAEEFNGNKDTGVTAQLAVNF